MATSPQPHVRRFSGFEADLLAGQLRKNGQRVPLQEQPFRVLALLLEKPGQVVTREELQEELWPDTHVDYTHSLNTAINKIREALGDSASSPRFVETLPGRGYKFLAPVEGGGLRQADDSPPSKADPQATIRWLRMALIGLAAALVVTAVLLLLPSLSTGPPDPPPVRRYSIAPAGLQVAEAFRRTPVSPDGRYIAYEASPGQGPLALWVHDLKTDEARQIVPVVGWALPFWSPDSRFLAFRTGSELKRVPLDGGPATTVCELEGFATGTWSPDGLSMVVNVDGRSLYEVPASGGEPRVIVEEETGTGLPSRPHFLPAPREDYLLYSGATEHGRIILRNLDNDEETDLADGIDPVYSPSGHIIYQLSGTLWALPFSLDDLQVRGEPFLVADGAEKASVASDGTLVYFERSRAGLQRLVWRDLTGRKVGEIGQPQKEIIVPSLSPDGRYVGVEGLEEGTGKDVWLHEVERPIKTRLTFDPGWDTRSIWSPDGKEVTFTSTRNGGWDLFVRPIDGSSEAVGVATPGLEYPDAWSPDGRHLLYHDETFDLYSVERQPDGAWAEPVPYTDGSYSEEAAQFSPDGRFVAYASDESGRYEVYVRPFPGGPGKWQVSLYGGSQPRWSRDGNELFFVKKDTLHTVEVSSQPGFTIGETTELFTSPDLEWEWRHPIYDVSLDGQRFVTVETIGEAPPDRIRIVQNWYEEFR